jgi:hypothetical protein
MMNKDDLIYGPTQGLATRANSGVDQLINSGDIAILALTTCLLFALIGNIVQYFVGNHRQTKDFDRYIAVTKAMAGIEGAIDEMKAIINVVIQMHKDNGP